MPVALGIPFRDSVLRDTNENLRSLPLLLRIVLWPLLSAYRPFASLKLPASGKRRGKTEMEIHNNVNTLSPLLSDHPVYSVGSFPDFARSSNKKSPHKMRDRFFTHNF